VANQPVTDQPGSRTESGPAAEPAAVDHDARAARRSLVAETGAALARSPFRVDRDRIVASPFFARLAGVTQVVSPTGSGLLVHNRLTHSLQVAQVGRAIAERLAGDPATAAVLDRLGGCDADVVEAAALAHDLGHPPFGHLGEQVLDRLGRESSVCRTGSRATPRASASSPRSTSTAPAAPAWTSPRPSAPRS
jgi:dGTP triphosphohydrolase